MCPTLPKTKPAPQMTIIPSFCSRLQEREREREAHGVGASVNSSMDPWAGHSPFQIIALDPKNDLLKSDSLVKSGITELIYSVPLPHASKPSKLLFTMLNWREILLAGPLFTSLESCPVHAQDKSVNHPYPEWWRNFTPSLPAQRSFGSYCIYLKNQPSQVSPHKTRATCSGKIPPLHDPGALVLYFSTSKLRVLKHIQGLPFLTPDLIVSHSTRVYLSI